MGDILKGLAGLLWPVFAFVVMILYRTDIKGLVNDFRERGGRFNFFRLVAGELRGPRIQAGMVTPAAENIGEFEVRSALKPDFDYRQELRHRTRMVRLVHRVLPAKKSDHPFGQGTSPFVVSAYIKTEALDPDLNDTQYGIRINDIDRVEYYFGKFFYGPGGEKYGSWFIVKDGKYNFAITYNAIDEVNCIAHVYLHSSPDPIKLYRFLDVEMGQLIEAEVEAEQASTRAGRRAARTGTRAGDGAHR
jgi:hypothetical protein